MRLFGLTAGRTGSATFAKACGHAKNYTAGHETRKGVRPISDRLDYPDQHVEADLTLTYLLGSLARRFDDGDTLYIHLRRDPEATALSWAKRVPDRESWPLWLRKELGLVAKRRHRQTLGHAIAHQFFGDARRLDAVQTLEACRSYVTMVDDQITEFLQHHRGLVIQLEDPVSDFEQVWERAGMEGDVTLGVAEYGTRHNAS